MRIKQSGNVVVFILLAVGLFGALAFTFTRGGQQGQSNMTEQQAKIAAQEILSASVSFEREVNRLLQKSCSENYINFDNDLFTAYANPNAPTDSSCDLFISAGGKLPLTLPSETGLDLSRSTSTGYRIWMFTGTTAISNLGTGAAELIAFMPMVNKATCDQINSMLGITTTYIDDGIATLTWTDASKFVGAFESGPGVLGNDDTAFKGKDSGCFYRNGHYSFYKVLIVR